MFTVVRRDPDKGYIDSWLWVPRSFINVDGTKQSLTYAISDGHSGATRLIALYREAPYHLLVPRAFWSPTDLPFEVLDCRPTAYRDVAFSSAIQLDHRIRKDIDGTDKLLPTGDSVQRKSLAALQGAMGGVLQLSCGKGKTIVALECIAQSRMPALVMVDNTQLLEQWKGEIESLVSVPGGIGVIASGTRDWEKGLVLATYISVANWSDTMPEEVRRWFGTIWWDEGHHLSAPVFSKTAPLFYGNRYCLTATPERDDGCHVIADAHVGPVLYKDLSQPLTATFVFKWTGLELPLTDPQCDVKDRNGEIHTSKVFKFFGRWRERLVMLLTDCASAVKAGRSVLLVGSSVDEVVNLMAMWTRGRNTRLITDIPYPTPYDVGETRNPVVFNKGEADHLKSNIRRKWSAAYKEWTTQGQTKRLDKLEEQLNTLMGYWAGYLVYKKCEALNERRRKAYIAVLMDEPSTAGFMTQYVPPKRRQEFVRERSVTFAIMKYGKEGLDAPHLDTILVSTPFTSKGGLQQLMGRITGRPLPGKRSCVVVIYRDNVGLSHGMCRKLEKHLREWPVDEGGPYDYTHLDHPERAACQTTPSSLKAVIGH